MKTSTITTGNRRVEEISDPIARRKINRMKNAVERMNFFMIGMMLFSIICIMTTVFSFSRKTIADTTYGNKLSEAESVISGLQKSIEDRDKVIAEKESEITLYQNDIVTVVNEYNKLYNDFTATTDMNVDLSQQYEDLVNETNSENAELEDLKRRAELYDKYNYAIINQMDGNLPEDQKRTDITYDQIETLESLAKDNGLSEDAVSLVLAIAMNESRGQEKSKNPYSTATGYCGILNTTGKYLYEDIMGNEKGSYSHDLAYNGYINLELSLQYIKYLNDMYGGDTLSVVNSYRGYYDAAYDSQLDANLQRGGKSLYTLHLGGD